SAIVSWEYANVIDVVHPDGTTGSPLATTDPTQPIRLVSAFGASALWVNADPGLSIVRLNVSGADTLLPAGFITGGYWYAFPTPDRGVWADQGDGAWLRLWRSGAPVVEISPGSVGSSAWIGDDGSIVGADQVGNLVRASPVDGHTLWSVPWPGTVTTEGYVLD